MAVSFQPAGVPGVRWRILGPVSAARGPRILDLGAPRQRAVLTMLLSRAGETVPLPRIVEALWGQEPPPYAVNVVHKHVGALRRLVEPGLPRRAQGEWLLSGTRGYRVAVSADTLDLLRFRSLVSRAQGLRDPAERLDLLEDALSLWRGPAAEDVNGEIGADPVMDAIDREHADAAILAAEDALSLGQAGRILPALTLAARLHPADETVHGLLMRSLASTGQRAAALEIFASLRTMLDEELGVPPGPVLADAHLAVLRDTVGISSGAAGSRAAALPVPRQLPAELAGFVGREDEVRAIVTGLRGGPGTAAASVVTGTAGVGKTTVAVHAAHALAGDFPGGQLYVDLRGFDPTPAVPAQDVLGRFLTALDIPADRIPAELDDRAALYRSVLGDRRVLVVLDNARDSGQVLPLLPGAGPSRAIITSRRQLRGLAAVGVRVVALDLFDHAQSERFLRTRLSDRAVDEEPASAADLIELSGGLPLALSLLAARAAHSPGLPLAEIAAAVRDASASLDAFADRADPRTSTRTVLSWSYASLTAEAARLFTLLAIHPAASVPADEAAALAGLDLPATRALMDELVEANMAAERAGGRIWRHDLLRRYAAELLEAAGPPVRDPAEKRLYEYLTPRAVAAARVLSPVRILPGVSDQRPAVPPGLSTEAEATAWFDAGYETIMALVDRAPAWRYDSQVWRLAWALDHYLDRRGSWGELLAMGEAGLAAAGRSGDTADQVVMRRGVARALANLGDFDAAAAEVHSALDTLAAYPGADPRFVSETYRQLSWVLSQQDDFPGALNAARAALDLHPDGSRDPVRAFALNAVGYCEAQLGLYDDALKHCTSALRLLERTTHRYGQADTWHSLGLIHSRLGHPVLAVQAHERALDLFRALGVRFAEADTSFELGLVYADLGRTALGRHYLETALRIFGELGHEMAGAATEALTRLDLAGIGPPRTPAD